MWPCTETLKMRCRRQIQLIHWNTPTTLEKCTASRRVIEQPWKSLISTHILCISMSIALGIANDIIPSMFQGGVPNDVHMPTFGILGTLMIYKPW
jgi:hypothetical protein